MSELEDLPTSEFDWLFRPGGGSKTQSASLIGGRQARCWGGGGGPQVRMESALDGVGLSREGRGKRWVAIASLPSLEAVTPAALLDFFPGDIG